MTQYIQIVRIHIRAFDNLIYFSDLWLAKVYQEKATQVEDTGRSNING